MRAGTPTGGAASAAADSASSAARPTDGAGKVKDAAQPPSFSLNITDAKSSEAILKILATEFGWREIVQAQLPKPPPSHAPASAFAAYRAALKPLAPPKGNIIWTVCPEALEQALIGRRGDQRVSHVPGMHGLCAKAPFALLAAAHGLTDFFPQTWIVELGAPPAAALVAAIKRPGGALILKPNDGTQGDGIFLVRTVAELERLLARQTQAVVVQRYLGTPKLLPGRLKFDIRLCAIATDCH